MKHNRRLWVGFCLLCHCTGTETGNPAQDEDAQMAFAPLRATVPRRGLGDVRFESVAIRVASVSLAPCAGGEPTFLLRNRSVELIGAEAPHAQIPAGSYCAVIVEIGGATDSFAAGRQVMGGKTTLTFESQLRARVRLELLAPSSESGLRPSWILGVDLAQWLDPIAAWLDGGDPQLSLDGPATAALRQAQARSLRLYEDTDADGQLDPAEIAAPLSERGTSSTSSAPP